MPAPACCLLAALFASSAVVEAAAGAEGEVAAGRAPIELDGPEENSVTFTLVPGAALDGVDGGFGNPLERFARLLPDVLDARMAGDVVADLPERRLEILPQEAVLVALHEVLDWIEHRFGDGPDVLIVRKHQRQFVLPHERARRNGSEDRIPFARQRGQRADVDVLQCGDGFEIAELELRHSAAGFLLDEPIRHFVVLEKPQEVVTDPGLVVIDIARREDRHFAGRARAVPRRPRDRATSSVCAPSSSTARSAG